MPTEILYGNMDNLQSIDTIKEFVNDNSAGLTVMEGGEHWFHTKELPDYGYQVGRISMKEETVSFEEVKKQ